MIDIPLLFMEVIKKRVLSGIYSQTPTRTWRFQHRMALLEGTRTSAPATVVLDAVSFKSPSNSSDPISQAYGYSHSSQWPQDFFPSLIQTQQPQSRAVPHGLPPTPPQSGAYSASVSASKPDIYV